KDGPGTKDEGPGTILVLHGGLSRADRSAALERFTKTPRAVLLATDAASEGLNLHRRCRLIVNLELPWNPVRLEQRVGRVDRIGQERTVHAFQLIAADTAETNILQRLDARASRARVDLGDDASTSEANEEASIARWAVFGETVDSQTSQPAGGPCLAPFDVLRPDLRVASLSETNRLSTLRALRSRAPASATSLDDGPRLAFSRAALRRRLGDKVLLVWQIECADPTGRTAERLILGTEIQLRTRSELPSSKSARRQWIDSLLAAVDEELRDRLATAAAQWEGEAHRVTHALARARLARERLIASEHSSSTPLPLQTGLFDRRAQRKRDSTNVARTEHERDIADRLTAIQSRAALTCQPAELILVLVP
ncbi:MAG TPA: C-terminal helicase domain-containing protein, partial [Vicinamibacterales bacterium]|nr:C-terminal helicase domain-containing protein [Vicinamibacterales bacterium]